MASPPAMSPAINSFDLAKDERHANGSVVDPTDEQDSAVGYDPDIDMDRRDEEKRVRAVVEKDGHAQDGQDEEEEVIEVEEDDDDVDDMFAVALDTTEKKKTKRVKRVAVSGSISLCFYVE